MKNTDIRNAILEAIYWWNRDESYYHKFFSSLDEIGKNKDDLAFFTSKIFEVFLREYSIRRNLAATYESVDILIEELMENHFVEKVKANNTDIVDKLSVVIKQNGKSTTRQTKSLLSKVAFLINPVKFSLYDSLAKESLWEIIREKKEFRKSHLGSYAGFIEQINEVISFNKHIIEQESEILLDFKGTPAFAFFSENPEAFNRRVIDKYLWIRNQNENSRRINNEPYLRFIKI